MATNIHRFIHSATVALLAILLAMSSSTVRAAMTQSQKSNTIAFLQRFPNSLSGLSWSGTDFCSWKGVTCNGDDTVTVNLSNNGLSGSMPGLGNGIDGSAVMVTSVDLSHNQDIRNGFKEDWAALKNLRYLDLSYTSLAYEIPSSWNGMTSLEEVRISNTNACKNLPNWSIKSLRKIDFSGNNMGGKLVSSWYEMTNLVQVDLSGNHFCGCVPDTWKTVSLLMSAANAANGDLAASNCYSSNACTDASFRCSTSTKMDSAAPRTTAVLSFLAAAVVVLAM